MSDLSELLEVLHEADAPFESLHARVRVWSHRERAHAAHAAFVAQAENRAAMTFVGPGRNRPPRDPEPVDIVSMWRIEPDRIRVEHSGGERDGLGIRVGEKWWSWSPRAGAMSNATAEDPSRASSGVGSELAVLWRPMALLGALRFEPLGRSTRAGRPVLVADARPRPIPKNRPPRVELHELGPGADRYRLEVDAERGFVLASQAFAAQEPFKSVEVLELDLHGAIDDELFVFHTPAGEEIRSPGARQDRVRRASISEAQAAARFTVLIPEHVPSAWTMHCTYIAGSERPPSPRSVQIHYRSNSGHEDVTLIERPADDDSEQGSEKEGWEEARAGSDTVEVLARGERGPQSQLRLERDGTSVLMISDTLSGEQLLGLAALLIPVPPAGQI